MQVVKKTSDYMIMKKRSGRYAVQGPNKVWICGDDKVQVLSKEGLIKVSPPKKKPEEPPAAEAKESQATEAPAESSSAAESKDS